MNLKEKKRYLLWFGLIFGFSFALGLILFSPCCWAAGNIHFGRLEVDPGFQIKETYNDDVNVDDRKSGGDWVTSFIAGVQLKWPIRRHTLKGNWNLTIPKYNKNSTWNYNEHNLFTEGNFIFGKGSRLLELDLKHRAVRSSEARSLAESRRKHNDNHFTSLGKLEFHDNARLDLGYDYYTYEYEDELDDRQEHHYLLSINLRLFPKTTSFLTVKQGNIEYDSSRGDDSSQNNSRFYSLTPGLLWDATAKLSGQVSCGLRWKDYEDQGQEDINTWVVMVDLTHTFTEYTKFILGLDRGEGEYSYSIQEPNSNPPEYTEVFNTYIFSVAQFSCQHSLTYKIATSLNCTFELDEYQGTDRNDLITSFGFGLTYQIQEWLHTALGFQQKNLHSQGDDKRGSLDNRPSSYTNNIISLSLGLVL